MEQGTNSDAEDRRCVAQELPGRRCEAQGIYLDRFWRNGWVCREHMPEYTASSGMVELMRESRLNPGSSPPLTRLPFRG